ncbi:MAG: polysaccharide biosynthesis protein [Nitrospinaceae bacterium]
MNPPFTNKTILITGGTGSFGTQMVRHLAGKDFREIRIFSRDETKQDEMRTNFRMPNLKFFLGDIRDKDSIAEAMKGTDLVFHAAAFKQVPSCEFFPLEAVRTNVLGSENVLVSAVEHGVQKVVCLSTDKAVFPINAMGMTKAIMEKVTQAFSRRLTKEDTTVCCVRYGNVIQSRGSVIPRFLKQIRENKPLTVTDPRMTRFLLSLEDAIDLVVFAFQNAHQGDLFIRKAPACSLDVLVQALKNILQADNPVQFMGIRHGEKIFETLASADELRRSQDLGDYFRIPLDDRDLGYEKYLTQGEPEMGEFQDFTSDNAGQLKLREMEDLLLRQPEIQALVRDRQPVC